MARILALEWDEREVRVAVAAARRNEATLEQAFSIPLATERGGPPVLPGDIGAKLGAALSARGVSGKMECLTAVGRSSIELRNLTLPPAPDAELPDMVRFQAQREFNALGEDWPLDYLPLSGGENEPRNVLAAAISPDLVQQINTVCQTAGLKPKRLVLRACAAAALLRRVPHTDNERVRLLVDLLTDEADLTVLVENNVVFLRTARLPGEPGSPEQARALTAELRRTMVAAQNRLGGGKVEVVHLCGGPAQQPLVEQLSRELALPCKLFHPFDGIACRSELKQAPPENPGRFAPLVGMLLDETTETPHSLDFLHPRRRPEPPSQRARWSLVAAGLAAVVLLGFGWVLFELQSADQEIAALNTKLNNMKAPLAEADKLQKRMQVIDKWLKDDIVWLDELRQLSKEFVNNKEALLAHLQMTSSSAGGEIFMEGYAQNSMTTAAMEDALRDPKHEVQTKTKDTSSTLPNYPWHFKSSITVKN